MACAGIELEVDLVYGNERAEMAAQRPRFEPNLGHDARPAR
jgi:hypothetical protein